MKIERRELQELRVQREDGPKIVGHAAVFDTPAEFGALKKW